MQRNSRGAQFSLLAITAVLFALGSIQGARLDRMRQVESLYRWVVTAATFSAFGETLEREKAEGVEMMDDELFAEVVALTDTALPDSIPVGDDDLDKDGKPHRKLMRAARQGRDKEIYRVLASAEAAPISGKFSQYLKEKRLVSVGTQFSASDMYQKGSDTEGVGLTSLFFGFRKLAANFLWMQVDSAWHGGQMHRFLPLMRSTVALDPNFVDAYLLGAWHLAYNVTARLQDTPEPQKVFSPKYGRRIGPKEEWYYIAVDFLLDGIKKNPRDYRLYSDLGYAIYESKLNDHANAVYYLTEAVRYRHDRWVPRMLCLAQWRNGQYDDALKGWQAYLKLFPDSYQAIRFIPINEAYLAEAKADQADECADAARAASAEFTAKAADADAKADAASAQKLREQAKDADQTVQQMDQLRAAELQKAAAIYAEIVKKAPDDAIAQARMLRRIALDQAKEGHFAEAVAYLDVARNQYLEAFDEFSDLIIDLKLKGGLPLSVSEQYALERRREAATYAQANAPKAKRFVECAYAMPGKTDAAAAVGASR